MLACVLAAHTTLTAAQPCGQAEWFTATRTGNKADAESCLMQSPNTLDTKDELGYNQVVLLLHERFAEWFVVIPWSYPGSCLLEVHLER